MSEMIEFYNALGAKLEPKQVKGGGIAFHGKIGHLNLSLFAISKVSGSSSPNFSMKLEVESLATIMESLNKINHVEILMDQESLPEGKLSIVIDPEGHSVELLEPWKDV